MNIEDVITNLELLADQVELSGHDDQIYMIDFFAKQLKDKPIVTETGDWKADEIVAELDRVSIKEIGVSYELRNMAEKLKGWN